MTDLVTIAPEEILGANVLIGILGLLLHGDVVGLVLPVGIPSHFSVDAGNEQAWKGNAGDS